MKQNLYSETEMINTPRVESVIAKVMARFPGKGEASDRNYYPAVHQELAPLARDLERETITMQARIQDLETWQRTICELLAPAGDEVRPEDAHGVVSCLRETLATEEEQHAQLQERCFGQGGQSVFDEVKQLQGELDDLRKQKPIGVFANVNRLTPEHGERWEQMIDEAFDGVEYIHLFAKPVPAEPDCDDLHIAHEISRARGKDRALVIGCKRPDDATRGSIMDAIAEAIGDAYDCTRVWSAWGIGTMGPDDFQSVTGDASRVAEIADAAIAAMIANSPASSETALTGLDAEFLAKRLGRVARLLDVPMPFQDDDKNADVAGTILADIARQIEERTAATTHCKFVLIPTWSLTAAADVLDRDGDEYGIAAKLRDMASAKPPLAPNDSQVLEWLSIARNDNLQPGDRLQRLICRMEPILIRGSAKEKL